MAEDSHEEDAWHSKAEANDEDGADEEEVDAAHHAGTAANRDDRADHHGEDRPAYDPHKITLPSREPSLRSTAPQSDFATTQVVRGVIVLALGLVLTFGLGIALA